MLKSLIATLALSALAFAGAVAPPDTYQVRYAANMNIGDSIINITNAGTAGGFCLLVAISQQNLSPLCCNHPCLSASREAERQRKISFYRTASVNFLCAARQHLRRGRGMPYCFRATLKRRAE